MEGEAKARLRKAALWSAAFGGTRAGAPHGQMARGEALSGIDPSVNPLFYPLQGQPTVILPLCCCNSVLCMPSRLSRPPSRAWAPHILLLAGGIPRHRS